MDYYESNPVLKKAIDLIREGTFSPNNPDEFKDLVNDLLYHDRWVNFFYFISLFGDVYDVFDLKGECIF